MHVYSIIALILAIASFGIILFIGLKTDILRESPPNDPVGNRMYSLGRFQLWIWTLVVCPVFALFWGFGLLHEIDLNTTAVILLGLPAGVALTSHVVGSSQASSMSADEHFAQANIQATPQGAPPAPAAAVDPATSDPTTASTAAPASVAPPITAAAQPKATLKMYQSSKGFFIDLISDDLGNLSLGRLQQFIFTLVFLAVYITTFFSTKMQVLPEFQNEVFILMGISSGTYLVSKGLKK